MGNMHVRNWINPCGELFKPFGLTENEQNERRTVLIFYTQSIIGIDRRPVINIYLDRRTVRQEENFCANSACSPWSKAPKSSTLGVFSSLNNRPTGRNWINPSGELLNLSVWRRTSRTGAELSIQKISWRTIIKNLRCDRKQAEREKQHIKLLIINILYTLKIKE